MNLYFFTGQFRVSGFICHQQEKARNKTRREGKVDKVLCPQIIISREQTVNKFTQRREPFVASSSEQLQVFFSTFYRMMGERAFLKYALSKRATMNPSTWLLAESMELCYAPTPLSFGSTARKVQKPFQVAPLRILPWPLYQTLSLNFNFHQTQVQSLQLSCLLSQSLRYAYRLKFARDFSKLLRGIVQVAAWI